MLKQVIIVIEDTGAVSVEAQGFAGQGCQAATAEYERALGAVASDRKKPEYFAATTQVGQQAKQ